MVSGRPGLVRIRGTMGLEGVRVAAVRKRERLFEIIMGALVALGVPLALGIPTGITDKAYAMSALLVIAAAAAALIVAWLRRPNRPFDDSIEPAPAPSTPARSVSLEHPRAFAENLDTGKWSRELLKRLEWRRFEELCAAYFEALGFRTGTTRFGAEGGVDIDLYAAGSESRSIIVRCRAWYTISVGIKPVRELRGAMRSESVAEGVFVTSGKFTQEARDFAAKENIGLIDGAELLRKLTALEPEQADALLKFATDGDFLTPTCPSCNTKMTPRTSTSEGRKFWGCRNYPRCKQTFFGATNAPA